MARPLVQIEGYRTLRRTLAASATGLEDLKAANAAAASIVEAEARRTAPRGRTGALAASIRSSGTRSAGYVRAGGARTPYPGVIEWGYQDSEPIEGQFYLTEAARAAEPRWIPIYERDLDRALSRVKGI